jgi:hypothetical protein
MEKQSATKIPDKPTVYFEKGKRHLVKYRGENLYIFLGYKTLEMNMLDTNKGQTKNTDPHTLVGLGIISKIISLCLEFDIDKEVIAGEIWTESRKKGDLADIISMKLING